MTVHPVLVCVLLLCGPALPDTEPTPEPCAGASAEDPLPDPGSAPAPTLLASEPDRPSPSPTEPSAGADPCPTGPEPLDAPPEAPVVTPAEEPFQGHQGHPGQQELPEPEREPPEKDGPAFQGAGPGQGPPDERAAAAVTAPVPPEPQAPEPQAPKPQAPEPEDGVPNPVGHFAFEGTTPSSSVTRVVGTASTTLLFLLGVGVLALRLTVGWPRFPTLYLGRRRSGAQPRP